jgi:hypothetical protein
MKSQKSTKKEQMETNNTIFCNTGSVRALNSKLWPISFRAHSNEPIKNRKVEFRDQSWTYVRLKFSIDDLQNVSKHCWHCYCWFSDHTCFSYGDTKLMQHIANNVYLHFTIRLFTKEYMNFAAIKNLRLQEACP